MVAPILVYEALVVGLFWSAVKWGGRWSEITSWPWLGLVPGTAWMGGPLFTLVGLLMVRRSIRFPHGWLQVLLAAVLASSVWYGFARTAGHWV